MEPTLTGELTCLFWHHPPVHFRGKCFDPLAQFLGQLRQFGVRLHQFQKLLRLARRHFLPFLARRGQGFAVLGIGSSIVLAVVYGLLRGAWVDGILAGITLATLYAGNGWIGHELEPLGIKVAFTPLGWPRDVPAAKERRSAERLFRAERW